MVAVDAEAIELLKSRLNGAADRVLFADMRELGANPALIISAWQDFVAEHAASGRPVRGIGEPVWPERTPAELAECERHESLLNLAFERGPSWRLLCPYDAAALGSSVLHAAEHNHPFIREHGAERESYAYREPLAAGAPFEGALPNPAYPPDELTFDSPDELERVRQFVADHTSAEETDPDRVDGLVLAVDEVVTNTLRHGGGRGVVRAWSENRGVVCEVSDAGTISDPLVGRIRPDVDRPDGRGLWIANHFCDLVQIRSSPAGTVVRCHLGPTESRVPV
jgi:anti-sigma regulatory factor (Ser/Thr protein kinase)